MKAFEVGHTYSTSSICDHTCIFSFTILKRTAKTITTLVDGDKVIRRLSVYEGVETFSPFGSYSMSPVINASRPDDTKETVEAVKTEDSPTYELPVEVASHDDDIIAQALEILEGRLHKTETFKTSSPEDTKAFLTLRVAELPHEVFGCLYLDNQHVLIKDVELFRGTIDGASVYPREVVKEALQHNAAAVIFYHNHPSGLCEPSQADKAITAKLKTALSTVDIRSLDHLIIAGSDTFSFAEQGLI